MIYNLVSFCKVSGKACKTCNDVDYYGYVSKIAGNLASWLVRLRTAISNCQV